MKKLAIAIVAATAINSASALGAPLDSDFEMERYNDCYTVVEKSGHANCLKGLATMEIETLQSMGRDNEAVAMAALMELYFWPKLDAEISYLVPHESNSAELNACLKTVSAANPGCLAELAKVEVEALGRADLYLSASASILELFFSN